MKRVLGLTVFAILFVGDWSSAAEDQVESVLIDLRNGGNRETARAFSRIRWLAWAPEEARQIVAALTDVMQESVESFGAEAAGAIECLASRHPRETRDAIPVLVELLEESRNRSTECAIMRAMGAFGEEAKDAKGTLRKILLGEGNVHLRGWAAAALARIGPDDEEPTNLLEQRLHSEQPSERVFAAGALAYVGPNARRFVADLQAALQDPDPAARVAAAEALWKIDDDNVRTVPVLINALSEPAKPLFLEPWGPSVAWVPHNAFAASVLGKMGPDAKAAIPALRRARRNGDPALRMYAGNALKKVDPE